MPSHLTNEGAFQLRNGGSIAYATDTIKARLCVAGTPNKDDVAMTGHTAATGSTDITLSGKTVTKDTTNDRIVFSATSPLTWTGLSHTGSATHIYVYKFVTNDADSIYYTRPAPTPTPGWGTRAQPTPKPWTPR